MVYMNRFDGKPMADLDHLRQSIIDIVTTPIGTRVTRRDYGADLFRLVDRSINGFLVLDMYVAIAKALDRWEPRLIVTDIKMDVALFYEGKVGIDIQGIYRPNGEPIRLEGVKVEFSA